MTGLNRHLFLLVAAMAATSACLSPVWAQGKTARIGYLMLNEEEKKIWVPEIGQSLAMRGWVSGRNLMTEERFGYGDAEKYRKAAAELVQLKVDVISASGAPALRAAFEETQQIPIVANDFSSDPVASGYAESYSRPGKNVTGVFLDAPEFAGKWLDILKALVPGLSRIAVLWNPHAGTVHLQGLQQAAKIAKIRIWVYETRKPEDLEKTFVALRGKPQAMVILPSPLAYAHSSQLAELALKHRLPAASMAREFAMAGGAVSYGPNITEAHQRHAAIVARILDGTKPGDIPIERPTKFDFLVNAKTVKTLGLRVPDALLLSAELVSK